MHSLLSHSIVFLLVVLFHMQSGLAFRGRLLTRHFGTQGVRSTHCRFKALNDGHRYFATQSDNLNTKRVVFLGTPGVAAKSLAILHAASKKPEQGFQIVGVVSQPPAPSGRNNKITKSPVHLLAEELNLALQTPELAKDESFLEHLEQLKVDLFVTAAYGNYLPIRFLNAAKFGTINIHPSLLPKYRGAAPVQRCLENGDATTGVSLLYSVAKMDAGPILQQIPYPLQGDEKADKVLEDCFVQGTEALLALLPKVFAGTATTTIQDENAATHAPKLTTAEGLVDFSSMSATTIHNRCRGFAEWPGIFAYFQVGELPESQRIKIITTCVVDSHSKSTNQSVSDFTVTKGKYQGNIDILVVPCYDGSLLGIRELQIAGKKIMDAKSFINGLRGKVQMKWTPAPIKASPGGINSPVSASPMP